MSSVQELRAALRPSTTPEKPVQAATTPDRAATLASSGATGILVLAVAIGLCAGIALDRFVLPHGTGTPAPAAAAVVAPQAAKAGHVIASGTLIQPDANNPLQRGAGGVSISDGKVVLDEDFAVTPGPDYRVLLVPKPAIRAAGDIDKTMYVDLGPLTAYQGSQSFAVPAGVDVSRYPSVVIWCARYGTLISSADLNFGG